MKIAVEGCMHGDLDKVYDTIKYIENTRNIKIDLLLCYGDFQAVRNGKDMDSLNVAPKYREMKSFWKYCSGQEVAPVPTIFIGGNNEASNYLWELYYGGWAAPNIYLLGYAVVVKFGNIRIDGLSGIYNVRNYCLGWRVPPYNDNTIRSVYHVREYDVHKLMHLEKLIDIFFHTIGRSASLIMGTGNNLFAAKKHFKGEIQQGTLGSKPAAQLLKKLRPSYWFSAYLHCKFTALVEHEEGGRVTKFLALDKCLPGRKFLQVQYDEEWLAITRKLNCVFPLTFRRGDVGRTKLDMQDCRQWVKSRMEDRGAKPCEFSQTAPPHKPFDSYFFCGYETLSFIFYLLLAQLIVVSECFPRNPQIVSFLELLDLPYVLDNASDSRDTPPSLPQKDDYSEDIPNEDEDDLEDDAERNNENWSS
ncbi:hypothetical protein E1A91_A07G261900v1 [Gossypium mustelinum]|uniref:Lariat debranching enzyme C-terminal domain-containing protein n=1 Tax=Gossypium mustelinum TaxID=34275 RepID=A0A5D2YTK8_GOSMU|nr:hypothetical protein E1A91_A07G261900v1 [Gossypium mustelinum]